MILKAIREGLGRLIILIDFLTRPKPMERPPAAQRAVEEAIRGLAIYQFYACPFCVKTRRALRRLNLPMELRDAKNDPTHRAALESGGGKIQVPCLRIDGEGETRWVYESKEIIAYLEGRFGAVQPTV